MVLIVIMLMVTSSFADANDMNGKGAGYYLVEDETIPTYSTTDQVKVKVIVQGRYSTDNIPIPIEANRAITLSGSTSYTVRDAMLQFNSDSLNYKAYDYNGNLISSNTTIIKSFVDGSRTWGSLFYSDIFNIGQRICVDGWMFKVNGRNPMKQDTNPSNPPVGTMMYETPIKDGDVITFFYNLPFIINGIDYSTQFIAADTKYTPSSDPNGTGTLEVQLQSTRDNMYDNQGQWTATQYVNYTPGTTKYASLYDSNYNYVCSFIIDSTGYGTLNINLSQGTYYLSVPTKTFKYITGYIAPTGNATTTCKCLDTTFVYDGFIVN
jgi:hypothetical protein